MTTFWIAVVAFAAAAAVFIAWPLRAGKKSESHYQREQVNVGLYREHLSELQASVDRGDITAEQFEQLKLELDHNLLEDGRPDENAGYNRNGKLVLVGMMMAVPVLAIVLYRSLGASDDWEIHQLALTKHESDIAAFNAGQGGDPTKAAALITKLEERLQNKPDNLQNWYLLARTALDIQDYLRAIKAYQQILNRQPESAQILGEFAQAVFLAAGNRMTPEAEMLVERTLAVDPNNTLALGLTGISAFEKSEFQAAIDAWQKAVQLMGHQAPGAMALINGINRAKKHLEESGQTVSADTSVPSAADQLAQATDVQDKADSQGGAGENGDLVKVTLNVSLGENVPADAGDTVFVYARAWNGPKMPLAIKRLKVSELPVQVVLDETMSMAPGVNMSSFPELELVARLSKSGKPVPEAGDWQVTRGPVGPDNINQEVKLIIDQPVL